MSVPSSRTLPCYIYWNFACGTILPSAETCLAFLQDPPNVVPQFLDVSHGSGSMVINFVGNPKGDMSIEESGLPAIY